MLISERMFRDEQVIRRVQMPFDTHQLYLRTERAHYSTSVLFLVYGHLNAEKREFLKLV
jgi:hypothetical protein